ncbi:MAG: hypothetical protein ACT4P4_12245 [Betaproteobacteria bacterium]
MASRKTKNRDKPFWERAYKGHAYWLGKKKQGKVTLLEKDAYAWEAAGRTGRSDDLDKAKRAVEAAVFLADKQLDLFNVPGQP